MIKQAGLIRSLPYVALITVATYFFHLAGKLDFDAPPERLGPDAWPKGILLLLILVCLAGIIRAIRTGTQPTFEEQGPLPFDVHSTDTDVDEPAQTWLYLPIVGSLIFVVYVLVLEYVGFVVSTAALVASFLYLGRYRGHFVIALCSVLGPLAFFYVFRSIAYVSLPLGKGPFLAVSLWLMKLFGMA